VANPDGKKSKTKGKVESEKIDEPPKNIATEGHFAPLQKRAKKVVQMIEEIIAY
jgi:hypothetical protein